MRFSVLALDYDGTIAESGELDPEVRQAITEARAGGITVILATGRILDDLRGAAGDLRFVDAIVAENGAVLAFPTTGRSSLLAAPASAPLVERLRADGVAIDVGACVVEADASAADAVLHAVRELELPLALIFNRGRLMVLPTGVNKASGLREALRTLRLSAHNAIGIGDAENDHDLLEVCELGVAVGWGSAALKAVADEVLDGEGPGDVARYIRRAVAEPRLGPARASRRRLLLGHDAQGDPVSLVVRGRNVLVAGEPRSGKSWVAGLLTEQLVLHRYSICVVDPEGDYCGLESMPGVVVLGGEVDGPTPRELQTALRYPDVNVVMDLSRLPHARKWNYIRAMLPALADIRRASGVPHRIVLDEAHYFLHDEAIPDLLDLELAGYTLVTYRPSLLNPDVMRASEAVIATRLTDARELDALAGVCGSPERCREVLGTLELGEAALLPITAEAAGDVRRFRLAPRLTSHVRHREKYLDVPIPWDRAFYFAAGRHDLARHADTLRAFIGAVIRRSGDELAPYLAQGDFSRWIAGVFGDEALAGELRAIEDRFRAGSLHDVGDAVVHAVRTRYEMPAAGARR